MATSGSFSTNSYDGRYYTVSWTASQDVINNSSTISWTLSCAGGAKSWYAERTLIVTGAGSTLYSKSARVERYAGNIASGSFYINHDTEGNANFSMGIQAAVYVSTVNCTGSSTFSLTQIPRKSTLSVGNGTLNTAQTLSVTRKSTSFTHTITATCGSASTTICTNSSSTSISFTPPIGWASQNTTGTTVSVKYTITTYSGNTSIGSNIYTVTCSIPSSVKPTCSLTLSDPTGYLDTYGGYVKTKSTLKVVIGTTTSYGSAIASYSTTANGSTYTASSFTTGALKSSGTMTVNAEVTDNRGRSDTASSSISVLDYKSPTVSSIKVKRCDSDGTENSQGEYAHVTFNGSVTSLNSKNTATYVLKYKKTSESSYTSVTLSDYANSYSVSNGTYIFAADSGSSYNITVQITDNFETSSTNTTVSTAATIMNWLASGLGMAIGKVAEIANAFEVAWASRFRENVCVGEKDGYLDGKPGVYVCKEGYLHIQRDTYDGAYYPYIGFLIDSESTRMNALIRYYSPNDTLQFLNASQYQFDNNVIINNIKFTGNYKVLWSGLLLMTSYDTANLSESILSQPNGIVLVWSFYDNGAAFNGNFAYVFVSKFHATSFNGRGVSCSSINLDYHMSKYVYVSNTAIKGYTTNDTVTVGGVTITNSHFVLRYVLGV